MTKLLLLFATLAFSVLFMFYNPHQGEIGFLFSDMVLTYELWFYYLFEHLIRLILAIVILSMADKYFFAFRVFVIIQCIEVLDYVLFYGEPWFKDVPLSWNIVKVALFGSVILYEKYAR